MQLGEAARIVKPYARTAAHTVGLFKTVISLEYFLELVGRYARAAVFDSDFDKSASVGHNFVKRGLYRAAARGVLQRVGQQIGVYLYEFVLVEPHGAGIIEAVCGPLNVLLFCRGLEGRCDTPQNIVYISATHLQLQHVVIEFVEIEQLVDELQHTVHIGLHYGEQAAVVTADIGRRRKLNHRPGYHGQRRAELVRHICEKAHIHSVDTLFLLLFHLGLPHGVSLGLYAHSGHKQYVHQGHAYQYINSNCPPRRPPCRRYLYPDGYGAERAFGSLYGYAHPECIIARCDIGIRCLAPVGGVDPRRVNPVEPVLALHTVVFAVVQCHEGHCEAVLVVTEPHRGVIRHMLVDNAALAGDNGSVVYLEVFKQYRHIGRHKHLLRPEECQAVGSAENNGAVLHSGRCPVIELVAAYAVISIEIIDSHRFGIEAAHAVERAYP